MRLPQHRSRVNPVVGVLAALAMLATTALSTDTSAAWTGQVTNPDGAAQSGSIAHTHTYATGSCTSAPAGTVPYASEIACGGTIAPTAPTLSTGSVSATDAIAYSGTVPASRLTQQVRIGSCGPVQFANRIAPARPMLARYGTSFAATGGPMGGAGYVTLDGANPGAYGSSVAVQSQPSPLLSLNQRFGLGVWFKTTSTAGGPLFGFSASPTNGSGSNDRILSMDSSGRLRFTYNIGGSSVASSAAFNDGGWHYAYITLSQISILFLGLSAQVTLYVDGAQVAQTASLLSSYSSYSGYWHIGWSSVSGVPSYFTGALSNFVVLNNSQAPANMGAPTSQAAFNTAVSSSVTEHWMLDDSGTTTYAGTLPVIGTTNPCSMVAGRWGFTSPTSCAWSPWSLTSACTASTALSQMVADGWRAVASPAPGITQTGTLSSSRAGTYSTAYLPGLRLYTPLLFRAVTTVGSWGNTFAWRSPSSVVLA